MKNLCSFLSACFIAASASFTVQAQTDDIKGLSYGYCTDDIHGVGFDSSGEYWIAAAMQLSEKDTQQFDGCVIDGVSIGFGSGRNKNVTIFMTYDLAGEPFYTQDGRTRANSWCPIPITEPVKIEKGKPIWIGYKYHIENSTAKPIGVDESTNTQEVNTAWMSAAYTEEELAGAWKDYQSELGNLCLRLYIYGENLSQHNCVPYSLTMPDIAYPGTPFEFTLNFTNASSVPVTSIEGTYKIGEDEAVTFTKTFNPAVEPNANAGVQITATTEQDALDIPVEAKITKVNGEDNDMAERVVNGSLTCTTNLFNRRIVAEKYSGLTCGYCPRGIVGFDYMWENYAQNFIPISVQNYSYTDPMYCSAYDSFWEAFPMTGAPYVWVNRSNEYTHNPEKGALENAYNKIFTRTSNIGITASFKKGSGNTLDVTGTVKVARDVKDAKYAMTFVITEDNVGPYSQFNGYSGSTGLPEWADKPQWVSMRFNHIARNIDKEFGGIANSVPSELKAGEEYSFTREGMSVAAVSDLDYANVIALLIDTETGEIINADLVHVNPEVNPSPLPPSGIESVNAAAAASDIYGGNGVIRFNAADGVAQVYSIDGKFRGFVPAGQEVNFASGIYIVRTPDAAVKVVVR